MKALRRAGTIAMMASLALAAGSLTSCCWHGSIHHSEGDKERGDCEKHRHAWNNKEQADEKEAGPAAERAGIKTGPNQPTSDDIIGEAASIDQPPKGPSGQADHPEKCTPNPYHGSGRIVVMIRGVDSTPGDPNDDSWQYTEPYRFHVVNHPTAETYRKALGYMTNPPADGQGVGRTIITLPDKDHHHGAALLIVCSNEESATPGVDQALADHVAAKAVTHQAHWHCSQGPGKEKVLDEMTGPFEP